MTELLLNPNVVCGRWAAEHIESLFLPPYLLNLEYSFLGGTNELVGIEFSFFMLIYEFDA